MASKPMTGSDVETIVVADTRSEVASPWMVLIYNDPVNLMSYVTMVIRKIFGYDEAKATAMMLDVHHKGKSIVWNGDREKAEFYVQQLQGYQLLAGMSKAGD